ncbi:MAG: APC family permease [Actinomycetota bacterium]|nr:APC family permease [Actinomycetota bacterium]
MSTTEGTPPRVAESVERFGYSQELSRRLTFTDLLVYGLIFMVPIAPFGVFGAVYSGSGGMVALAYAIGMAGMAFTALSYAEMARAFPMAGSVYTYAGRGLAPAVGFLAGWVILLDYVLVPALLYLVAGVAMSSFLPAVPVWAWVVLFIVLNTVVNYFGIETTARVNKVMLVGELIVLAIFLVVGIGALLAGRGQGFSFTPLYNPETFSLGVVFSAVSLAVLSFLGFDGISTLAEENRQGARQVGRAMVAALVLAGTLFIVQTWVASLLVPDPARLLAEGDPGGTAFYDAAEVAGGAWLSVLTAVTTAVAWGFANALAAQVATSRLLFAMARDGQLPSFLARIDPRRRVPVGAILLVAAVSLAVGIFMARRENAITELGTLVNFGALTAFLLLHLAVMNHYLRRHPQARSLGKHLVVPVCGLLILGFVVYQANVAAQRAGLTWLALGVLVLLGLYLTGRRPTLAGLDRDAVDDDEGART